MTVRHFLGAVALAASATVASAAPMVRAQDPQSLVTALKEAGYKPTLGVDKVGDPIITLEHEGTTFQVYFYNCTANKDCATITFHSGYDLAKNIGLEKINEWNEGQRFGRAYLDKENDPIIEMDVDLDDGGMSPLLFIDNVEFWTSTFPKFEQHIGFRE